MLFLNKLLLFLTWIFSHVLLLLLCCYFCISTQHQCVCVCAALVGHCRQNQSSWQSLNYSKNKYEPLSPSGDQLCESHPSFSAPSSGSAREESSSPSVHGTPWKDEKGRSSPCAGDWQSVTGGRSTEISGNIWKHKKHLEILLIHRGSEIIIIITADCLYHSLEVWF